MPRIVVEEGDCVDVVHGEADKVGEEGRMPEMLADQVDRKLPTRDGRKIPTRAPVRIIIVGIKGLGRFPELGFQCEQHCSALFHMFMLDSAMTWRIQQKFVSLSRHSIESRCAFVQLIAEISVTCHAHYSRHFFLHFAQSKSHLSSCLDVLLRGYCLRLTFSGVPPIEMP